MPQIILRPYQEEAVRRIVHAVTSGWPGNDLIILSTAAGKSIVVSHVAKQIPGRILVLQPSKEILEQNRDKMLLWCDPDDLGVYSDSAGEKVSDRRITLATIGSIYRKPELFRDVGLVIVDEAHLVSISSLESSMYGSFLKAIGLPHIVGLTATPYRLETVYETTGEYNELGQEMLLAKTGIKLINRMRGKLKKNFWDRILYNVPVSYMLREGYICPLKYDLTPLVTHQEIRLNKSESDFDLEDYEEKTKKKAQDVIDRINLEMGRTVGGILVFCSSVSQAQKFTDGCPGSAIITGTTPKKEREAILEGLRDGSIKAVMNVGCLTTGLDIPPLDTIILNRPTRSLALLVQMLGRGVRLSPGKASCTVIDFTDTVRQMGRFETVRMEKHADGWQLLTETGSWHGKHLFGYKFALVKKPKDQEL